MSDSTSGGQQQKQQPPASSLQQQKQQQRQKQLVQEERLRNLLSSIGHLSVHGEVPVYAFGTLISTAPPQAIAEHLHQRWLADPNFCHIAPKIVLQMSGNVTVCSQVLSFALRDFNTRHDIRAQSRGMFRNFARTLVELYPVYRKIDKCLSACLIEPLFRCLQMLVEEDPDDRDLHCIAHIVVNSGRQLSQLNPTECDRLVLACRRWLCSNRVPLEEETRRLLMNAIDLWTYSWDRNLFPDCLRRLYEESEAAEQRSRKQQQRGHFPYSSAARLDRQLSNMAAGASYSSQQMSDSASSSLPSSALALDTQTHTSMTTKSQPQSRTSLATLAAFPPPTASGSSSTTAPLDRWPGRWSAGDNPTMMLPNGNSHNGGSSKKLGRPRRESAEEAADNDNKESAV